MTDLEQPLNQERLEAGDDNVPNRVQKLLEGIGDDLALATLPLPELYLQGKLKFHLQYVSQRVSVADYRGMRQFCATVEGLGPLQVHDDAFVRENSSPELIRRRGNKSIEVCTDEQDRSVLVDVSEVVEDRQRVIFRPIRSVVRLRGLDDCECSRVYSSHNADVPGVPLRIEAAVEDRERRFVTGRVSCCQNELPGEMIESGAEILDTITHDKGEVGRDCLYGVDDEGAFHEPLVIKILIFPDRVRVALDVPSRQTLEFFQVHPCSSDLCLDSSKSGTHW